MSYGRTSSLDSELLALVSHCDSEVQWTYFGLMSLYGFWSRLATSPFAVAVASVQCSDSFDVMRTILLCFSLSRTIFYDQRTLGRDEKSPQMTEPA